MRTSDVLTPTLGLQQKEMPGPRQRDERANEPQIDSNEQSWMRVCAVEEIPRLGARVVKRTAPPDVAIFRTADDRVFALADRCPHRGGPLSQGIVFGHRVACPLHNTCVELESGCAVAPDKGEVRSYPVKVEAGSVYVDLEVQARAEP